MNWSITPRKVLLVIMLVAAISLGGYLLGSLLIAGPGFPLDDAWIHQTYARNLATNWEWSFILGQPSAGSTAPAWSMLLAVGQFLRLGPYIWTFLLGWLLLVALAWLGMQVYKHLSGENPGWLLATGLLLVLEWHLVWAAGSGMETLLLACSVLAVFAWLLGGRISWLGMGLLIGLSIWIRPDAVTLLGPAGLVVLVQKPVWKQRLMAGGKLAMGVLLLFVPYLVFNRLLAGDFWPNTFFAKQAEYAVYRELPLFTRLGREVALPLIGVGAILLPGFILFIYHSFHRKQWAALAGVIWLLGYIGLYTWRLPVTYQHGRYIIPAMPVYFVWGLAGMSSWLQPNGRNLSRRVISNGWIFSSALLLTVFWFLGARAYGQDVGVINSEMVATARWVSGNTDPQALIAAHDIGALGYFADRRLIDLAGLVSPEVIPFIRDETRLAEYLDSRQADYLVTFPGWYPDLVKRAELVHTSQGSFAPQQQAENMSVYRWGAH